MLFTGINDPQISNQIDAAVIYNLVLLKSKRIVKVLTNRQILFLPAICLSLMKGREVN